ncbi:MAG: exopolyphosphatase [Lachnospiraceae bacterium]|nr:exopolyphosphatase [Lachnospiraceae bacterium]
MELVTRSDLDGLVAGAILIDAGVIEDGKVRFVHPKDVQDGKVELSSDCITTNLPFDPRVGMAFDHHESENERLGDLEQKARDEGRLVLEANAKSAARVVYNYYKDKAVHISEELVAAADKCDSADLTLDEIFHPTGWVLLHYIMDARSGFGRFHDFKISNYDLMMKLMHFCIDHGIDEVMELPDVKERVDMYFEHEKLSEDQLRKVTTIKKNVAVVDFRNEETIYTGNRFKIYAMYPEIKFSIHVAWGKQKMNTALMVGKSIVNKAGTADIGKICLEYGGGGHAKAGTCQVANEDADRITEEIIEKLQK